MRLFQAALALFVLASCSSPHRLPEDIVGNPSRHDLETAVILGTNDIHGALMPIESKTREPEGTSPIQYRRGGVSTLASMVKTLRNEFGPRFLILDGGDEFQGTLESNLQEGAPMVQIFNLMGLSAAAVGNHEFDFGPVGPEGSKGDLLGALKARMSEAKYRYLAANIIDKRTGVMPEFPNTTTRMILNAGRLKIGVFGLSTLDTPTTTRAEHVVDLKFTELKEAAMRESEALRKEGAHIVVLTTHAGLKCQPGRAPTHSTFRKESDPQGGCDDEGEVVKLLRALPPKTLDAVVSGHSHTVVHHWVQGVPVIQGGTRNQYFNILYLTYDFTEGRLLTDRLRIEGPVPVCEKIFENQKNCDADKPNPNRGDLVSWSFHGKRVEKDSEMEKLLEPIVATTDVLKRRVIGHAARPLDHDRAKESAMGNLVADAMRHSLKADASLINGGGIRSSIDPGPITFESLFRALPFDNSLSLLTVTGKELRNILRTAESGAKGVFPVSGLKIRALEREAEAPSDDLNKNGKIEPWEVNRLLDVRLADGAKIKDEKLYKLATVDFLVLGGDDLGWAMKKIPAARIEIAAGGLVRDEVEKYITANSPINGESNPLVDAANSRLKFEKAALKSKRKRRRAR